MLKPGDEQLQCHLVVKVVSFVWHVVIAGKYDEQVIMMVEQSMQPCCRV